jgi:radical SAM superfamily enzyme YgiQ (UPF0313 family)
MKILFQEPFVEKDITFGKFSAGAGNNTFPYGVACLAQYTRNKGHVVKYLEPTIEKMDNKQYKKYLLENKFDVIGIGSTTLQIGKTIRTFELIKKINPKIITVLGGIHGTIMSGETLDLTESIDYIILGEGEKPFCSLLEKLEKKDLKKIKNISGIAFKNKGKKIINPPDFSNMLKPEEFPMPAYDLFPMHKYVTQVTYSKNFPTYSLLCSRGCVFKCAFCNASDIMGRKVRYKDPDEVIKEILILKNKYGAKGIMFNDSTFTVNNEWVEIFCKKLIEKKINISWTCNSRVDTVNEKLLRLMKKAGCWEILYGIESGNQKSLDLINKKTTVEQNTRALKLSMKLGIYTYATYILCLPGETKKDALNTIKYAKKIATPIAMFYLPIPFPKTELWRICKEQGILREDAKWEDYNAWDSSNPVYVNPKIGKKEMGKILKKSYVDYYTNPIVLLKNLKEMIFLKQNPRRFLYAFKALGGFLK